MKRVVIVVLDGLRRDMVGEGSTPAVAAFRRRAAEFASHRSVFPSATRVASASFATGCYPATHGLQGNSMALLEEGVLAAYDAGAPDFLEHKRRVTGAALEVPTLAERVRGAGGAVMYSNASPGAARAHDPNGAGFVYNRAGSFGPGGVPVPAAEALRVTPDIAGDGETTRRFVADALGARRPALAVLWLHEPDHLQHAVPLGSPAHLAGLRAADAHAGEVIEAVGGLRRAGDEVLFVVGSDHGHQTVVGLVDIHAELVAAGLKDGPSSGDVLSVSSGTSALVYVHPTSEDRLPALEDFLASRAWAGRVVPRDRLADVGQAPRHGLAFAISLHASDGPNGHGVPGLSFEALPREGKEDHLGFGQHGGLGTYEQSPVLLIGGPGFEPGRYDRPTSLVDIAPTVLAHLGLAVDGTDGRALQGAAGCPNPSPGGGRQ